MFRKIIAPLFLCLFLMLSNAMADTSVSWVTPPDGSTYLSGTILGSGQPEGAITGVAGTSCPNCTGLDLMLVIDVSGSMGGSRIAAAKTAASALINSLPDHTTQVGIVTFNSYAQTVEVLQDLTSNKATLLASVNGLLAYGGTSIDSGIAAATAELTGGNAIAGHQKMQVVLSDGQSSYPMAVGEAMAAQAAGITIHTVGVPGHDAGLMEDIAIAGGGVYTNAANLDELVDIFSAGGGLVGLDHVDIQLADGTWIYDITTDALGNFILPDQSIFMGTNTFTAHAWGTDGSYAVAELNLNGRGTGPAPVPEPATLFLLGSGLLGVAGYRRKTKNP